MMPRHTVQVGRSLVVRGVETTTRGCRETMPEMDTADAQELRMLRARAYGPAADIAEDYAAIRRLRELEDRRAGTEIDPASVLTPVSVTDATTSIAQRPSRISDPVPDLLSADDAPEPSVAPDSGVGARTADHTRWRWKLLWIASLVASSALAASVTYAMTWISPVSVSSGAAQIDTLEPNAALAVPVGWFGANENSIAFDFYGLTLFTGEGNRANSTAGCLYVVGTDQVPAEEDFSPTSWSFEGELYTGCNVGVFPAAVEIPLGDATPDELNAHFPSGRALQFVLDGDRVGVFLDSE